MKNYLLIAVLLSGFLGGCAAYQARPLDMTADMAHRIPSLTENASKISLLKSDSNHFNPDDGLDIEEVAILAVANNPALKLARDDVKIARSKALDAGLLPNPQLSAGLDFPTSTTPGSTFTATNFGLSYDLAPLLTRNTAKEIAESDIREADMVLLWQEWQVISQARMLFAKSCYQKKLFQVLTTYRNILSDRHARIQKAFKDGNLTLDSTTNDLSAFLDIHRQIDELTRQIHQTHCELSRLMGLSPDVTLNLVGNVTLQNIDKNQINSMLDQLAYRRPDLLALKAGYETQDLKYRQSIIQQFPAISVGITQASDTSNVHTIGPSITLSLPLFNQHQGKIAIEKASRKRLYDEFENRLMNARSTISQILADQSLLKTQLKTVSSTTTSLKNAVDDAEKAYATGNITELAYTALYARLFHKTLEQLNLEQASVEQRIALQTLLGSNSYMTCNGKRKP